MLMPEAAMGEDREIVPPENDIRRSRQLLGVQVEPQAYAVQRPTHQLRLVFLFVIARDTRERVSGVISTPS
jgi:hypothetical protein